MTQYRYDAAGKSALRSAITSHHQWDEMRARHGISSATLTVELMETIAAQLNPPIDCSAYGRPRSTGYASSYGLPKPKTVSPDDVTAIFERGDTCIGYAVNEDQVKYGSIRATILGQGGWATEGQKAALLAIIMRA